VFRPVSVWSFQPSSPIEARFALSAPASSPPMVDHADNILAGTHVVSSVAVTAFT
jgi:hypothetical protein